MSQFLAALDNADPFGFIAVLFGLLYVLEMVLFVRARRKTWFAGVLHGYEIAARQAAEAESYRMVPDTFEEAFR
jgi:hypothetical protein